MTYEWDRITPTAARWQQANSVDGEQTWEKNWEMPFTARPPSRRRCPRTTSPR